MQFGCQGSDMKKGITSSSQIRLSQDIIVKTEIVTLTLGENLTWTQFILNEYSQNWICTNYNLCQSCKLNFSEQTYDFLTRNLIHVCSHCCLSCQESVQFIITSYILGLFSGVPDYCEKMHNVAKSFHQQKQQSESSEASRYDQISSALSNKKQTIAVWT